MIYADHPALQAILGDDQIAGLQRDLRDARRKQAQDAGDNGRGGV